MDPRAGGGRGRGRGRSIAASQTPSSPPPAVEPKVKDEDLDEKVLAQIHLSTPTPQTSSVESESEPAGGIGRGRGRGVSATGRGRGLLEGPRTPPRQAESERKDKSPTSEEQRIDSSPEPPVSPTAEGQSPPKQDSPPLIETVKRSPTAEDASTPKGGVQEESDKEPPVVKRSGEKGTPANIKTNYLRLRRKDNSPGMVEYHVSFECSKTPIDDMSLRKRMLSSLVRETWPVRVFDGMVLILPYRLPVDPTVLKGNHPNDPEAVVTVTVAFVKVRTMKNCMQFYNNLLHRCMKAMNLVELRREFYDLNMVQYLRQHKLEIWPGKNVTAENQEDGLMVWVDSCSRVLQEDTAYIYYQMIRKDPNLRAKYEEFIIGKIVLTRYNNRCYRIDAVDWSLTPKSSFVWMAKERKDNGRPELVEKEITFAEYLRTQYAQKLTGMKIDMDQPMLISKVKPRRKTGVSITADEEPMIVALIPQLCNLTGLTEDQRNNFKVMTDLAASTRLTPAQRMKSLQDFINAMLGNERVQQMLGDWGLVLEKNVIEVCGRVMDGPDLKFNDRNILKKAGPDFSKNATQAVFDPVDIKKFAIICTQRDVMIAKNFMDTYTVVCRGLGIKMLQVGEVVQLKGAQAHQFVQALNEHCDPNKMHFVVLVMPGQREDIYSAVKRLCVSGRPIPSQCVLSKTLSNERKLRSVVMKIALQINCKLGGALWALQMPLKEHVMFVGIDAAHDPKKKDPSVICLIASLNNQCTRYFSRSHTNPVHQDAGNCLKVMMREALRKFYESNGQFPSRVIVYRDGGSVGALDDINNRESDHIKEAINEVCVDAVKDYTFVVVTKRIPQRLILEQSRNSYANPHPGTVVDSVITRRHLYDFYIVSQQVREGTVNPTHFVILDKDDKIRPDLIQRMTYATCFMYYNWSGTVRVPAMVQYAHKLAALLIRHVKANPHRDICTTLYYL